jgi:uncharacterized protein YbjT (DUF2867 family)
MRIILLGATGLVGNHLLSQLLATAENSESAHQILVLGRNKPEVVNQLQEAFNQQVCFIKTDLACEDETAQLISNFRSKPHLQSRLLSQLQSSNQDQSKSNSDSDILICCLGTTIKAAGSRAAFSHVDFDLVLSSAKAAKTSGIKRMMLISAINANANSSVFYSKIKGQVEQAAKSLGFEQIIVIKPSLLMGQRKTFRFAETLSAPIMKILNPILQGKFKKYRAVEGGAVAKCMVEQLNNPKQGVLEVYPTDYESAS